jgi:hypothetical protein
MNSYLLSSTDPDDINDALEKLERSFGIMFPADSSSSVTTLGDLIDWLDQTLPVIESADCSSQQAFYKLRTMLAHVLSIHPGTIRPDTALNTLVPAPTRRQTMARLNRELGITPHLLAPPLWSVISLLLVFFGSLIALKFSWPIALAGLFLSIGGFGLAHRFANTFTVSTVGDLVRKLSREHYCAMRRNPSTVNRRELEPVVMELLSRELGIPRQYLTRESSFN